ncbi:MAG: orotate phosphoribosyltransferase [Polyangia bacterium]
MDREIAGILLEIGAVSLRVDPPYTWASGRLAPLYCDNRLLMSHLQARARTTAGLAELLDGAGWRPEVIAGTATAGIPHAAWLSERMKLPMVYVRGSAKGHGKQSRIEGLLESGQSVVLIEDLVSTGGSSLEAAGAVTEAGGNLLGVAAIFSYELDAASRRFDEAGTPLATLTGFGALMDEALSRGRLSAADKAILADWRRDPAAWSAARGGEG